jgi:ABC-2 type transport system ATP-binding protein
MTSAAPAILARTDRVTRRYGDTLALDGVDLSVAAGELVGLLGPNGAGKSTLINLLVGIRRPTSGSVEIFGGSPLDPVNRRLLGVTPQETGLPPTLRVGEVVDYVSAHFQRRLRSGSGELGPNPLPRKELLARFGLDELARRQTGGLSGGQRRRLAVALAFVGRPRLVVLDEPTTGLDVEVRHVLWDAIRAFHADGGTVLLSSHYLEEVEALAQRVVVLGEGHVLADDTVAAVRGLVGVHRVSLAAMPIPDLPGVVSASESDGRLHLLTPDADELVRTLVHSGIAFRDLEVRPTTLEEAFLHITARREPLTGVSA